MTARRITVIDVQFQDARLARLVQQLNRWGSEIQRIQDLLEGGQAGEVLTKLSERDYAGEWSSASSAGEANTGANIGDGVGVFAEKDGVTLRFRSLVAGDNVEITTNADGEIVIAADADSEGLDPVMLAGCF